MWICPYFSQSIFLTIDSCMLSWPKLSSIYEYEKKNNPMKYLLHHCQHFPHICFNTVWELRTLKPIWKQIYCISSVSLWEATGLCVFIRGKGLNIPHTVWYCQNFQHSTTAMLFFSQRNILFPSPRQSPLLHFAQDSDHLAEHTPSSSDPHLADHDQRAAWKKVVLALRKSLCVSHSRRLRFKDVLQFVLP